MRIIVCVKSSLFRDALLPAGDARTPELEMEEVVDQHSQQELDTCRTDFLIRPPGGTD